MWNFKERMKKATSPTEKWRINWEREYEIFAFMATTETFEAVASYKAGEAAERLIKEVFND